MNTGRTSCPAYVQRATCPLLMSFELAADFI